MRLLNFKRILAGVIAVGTAYGLAASSFTPAGVSFQSGGGMGAVSAGAGWIYGKANSWESEIFIGLIPGYDSGSAKAALALKENYVPWHISLNRRFTLEPLTASVYLTTVVSKRFWVKQPDRYPSGYYGLSTKVRGNIAIGQRLRWQLPLQSGIIDSISAYYELGTCDIYVLSVAGNHEIKPHDWLQLCIGIKINFRK